MSHFGELVFNGDRISVWEDGKIWEVDGSDGCMTMCMCLMPLDCHEKMFKMGKPMFCVIHHANSSDRVIDCLITLGKKYNAHSV